MNRGEDYGFHCRQPSIADNHHTRSQTFAQLLKSKEQTHSRPNSKTNNEPSVKSILKSLLVTGAVQHPWDTIFFEAITYRVILAINEIVRS